MACAGADVFRVIADPTRRTLLDELRAGEQSAGAMARRFETTTSAISQHLKILLDAGLVHRHREGRSQIYALRPEPLREVAQWIASYEQFWNSKLDALGEYLARTDPNHSRKP